jgi:predicted RNase H-like nuclease
MSESRVLGVDACHKGWIGVATWLDTTDAYFGGTIRELVTFAEAGGGIDVVAIDIPIGLPDNGRREADILARTFVGPRWQSVFMTPVRPALEATEYADAVAINHELAGEGLSRQAFGLKTKIFEIDAWIREGNYAVIEVHPEVCFANMANGHLHTRKKTWAGVEKRRQLLDVAGIQMPNDLGLAGEMAAVDDVLDAAAAAWTARRYADDRATSMPENPEMFSDRIKCAIWA